MTGKNYETIWLEPECEACDCNRQWCQDNVWDPCPECGLEPVKYVRADIAEAAEKERDELQAALAEALPAIQECRMIGMGRDYVANAERLLGLED